MLPMNARLSCMRWLALCLFSTSVLATPPDGVVAVSHPAAAAAGAHMLALGGNDLMAEGVGQISTGCPGRL